MDILSKVHQISWKYLVRRREAVLMGSLTNNCYPYFAQATGIDWTATVVLRTADGQILHVAEEYDALHDLFVQGGIPLFTAFRDRLIRQMNTFFQVAQRIETTDCSRLSDAQLQSLLQDFITTALPAHCFLLPLPIADTALVTLLLPALPPVSAEQQQEWLQLLTFPLQESSHLREEKSFYNLVQLFGTTKFESHLTEHLRQFAWIGARWYWWQHAWTKQDIFDRIIAFQEVGKDPLQELETLEKVRKNHALKIKALQKQLKLSSSTKKLVELAQEFVHLRTWRTDIIYGAGYKARGLFYEIARRVGLPKEDIVYFSHQEIYEMLTTNKIPNINLSLRKKAATSIVVDGKYFIYDGREWEKKFLDAVRMPQKNIEKINGEIRGSVAYPGNITGTVKVVHTTSDLTKVQPGDILVAVMTFPHFIPAMEKAAAFVTDEGGILCHAAIVSREMQKPCLIGTKKATEIFHDGELVEVDATKGIVRKL